MSSHEHAGGGQLPSMMKSWEYYRKKNAELDDMILIKSDGYPTYNFANVIDDHLMGDHPCGAGERIPVLHTEI